MSVCAAPDGWLPKRLISAAGQQPTVQRSRRGREENNRPTTAKKTEREREKLYIFKRALRPPTLTHNKAPPHISSLALPYPILFLQALPLYQPRNQAGPLFDGDMKHLLEREGRVRERRERQTDRQTDK